MPIAKRTHASRPLPGPEGGGRRTVHCTMFPFGMSSLVCLISILQP
jgi:hypothetical protein